MQMPIFHIPIEKIILHKCIFMIFAALLVCFICLDTIFYVNALNGDYCDEKYQFRKIRLHKEHKIIILSTKAFVCRHFAHS